MSDSRSSRSWVGRLLLVGLGLGVGLGLAEGAARLLLPPLPGFVLDATLTAYEPRLYQRHPTRITTLAPGADVTLQAIEYRTHVRTDRLGLRGAPPPHGDRRIAFVGDSFTLAVQVPEDRTFAEQVARRLSERGPPTVALNAGVDGYGVVQSVDRLEELLRSTRVTHAVLTVYLGNDLRDDARLAEKRAAMAQPPPADGPAGDSLDTMRRKSGWARTSRLYAWGQVVRALRARADDFRMQEYADELSVFTDASGLTDRLSATASALARFRAVCAGHRLTCGVALAPPAWAVHTERTEATFSAFGLDAAAADVDRVAAAVGGAVPAGVAVVDLTGPLRAAAASGPLYFTFDPHWTPAAHGVVADTLVDELGW